MSLYSCIHLEGSQEWEYWTKFSEKLGQKSVSFFSPPLFKMGNRLSLHGLWFLETIEVFRTLGLKWQWLKNLAAAPECRVLQTQILCWIAKIDITNHGTWLLPNRKEKQIAWRWPFTMSNNLTEDSQLLAPK